MTRDKQHKTTLETNDRGDQQHKRGTKEVKRDKSHDKRQTL